MNWSARAALTLVSLTWVSLSACSRYGGVHCEAITTNTPFQSLPARPPAMVDPAVYRQSQPFIDGTAELHCCVANAYYTPAQPLNCAEVDCAALYARVTVAHLEGVYSDEPCGRDGIGHCNVYLDGDRIIGVRARCDD